MLESLEAVGKKWCHQLTNVIQEVFGRLAGRSAAKHREEWHHNDQRSRNVSCRAMDQMFLPVLNCKLTGSWKSREDQLEAKMRTSQRPMTLGVPRLIYSCVDRTLHLFIVFIYLLGSWISPAVHVHSLAYILATEKMLLTVCGFYCYH